MIIESRHTINSFFIIEIAPNSKIYSFRHSLRSRVVLGQKGGDNLKRYFKKHKI
jgi:hypothetical protein